MGPILSHTSYCRHDFHLFSPSAYACGKDAARPTVSLSDAQVDTTGLHTLIDGHVEDVTPYTNGHVSNLICKTLNLVSIKITTRSL